MAEHLNSEFLRIELGRRCTLGAHGTNAAWSCRGGRDGGAAERRDWYRVNGSGSTCIIAKVVSLLGRRASRGELRCGRIRNFAEKHGGQTTRNVKNTMRRSYFDHGLLGDVLLNELVLSELGKWKRGVGGEREVSYLGWYSALHSLRTEGLLGTSLELGVLNSSDLGKIRDALLPRAHR